ncbi:hypothetical protein GRAN_4264 [Granulicella sibirica]|uniref:Uncharacterized protein n=1 Tax=Granulicella sibirica TaxID=2479048 RepID=A0A4Q0SYU3_9BACT|nr:hypothetical protein GRAN_4264 [Granulicella sibirica]
MVQGLCLAAMIATLQTQEYRGSQTLFLLRKALVGAWEGMARL